MWLNNYCCVCTNCKHEYNEKTKEGCKDCRWMRDLERLVAHTRSFSSGEHDIEVITCISKCPRFESKDDSKEAPVCEKKKEMILCT